MTIKAKSQVQQYYYSPIREQSRKNAVIFFDNFLVLFLKKEQIKHFGLQLLITKKSKLAASRRTLTHGSTVNRP